MSLYFAVFPTYTPGFYPAVRECFSFLVAPDNSYSIDGKKPTYSEAYDYCVFMPVDRKGNVETGELYNWSIFEREVPPMNASNKTSGKAVGPMAWIHKNQGDVFQFVMFGGLCGIDTESQQAILDKIAENAPSGSPLAEKRKANVCP